MRTLSPQNLFRSVFGAALVLLLSGGAPLTQAELATPVDRPESVAAQDAGEAGVAPAVSDRATLLSPADLATVVAPIALYPDDLIAIVLPASTYPLQVVQAARFLESVKTDASLKPDPAWDDSVVALTNYPEVVALMNGDLDWTWKLGQAVINQQGDVLSAVQDFRRSANAAGNLKTDDRQVVTVTPEEVEVKPADPTMMYVPYYEPAQVTVYQPYPVYHYYPVAYPVYYYPYPDDYVFGWPYFWGVTTFYSLGWSTHHVNYYQYHDYGHPYYASRYCNRWYYRRPYYAGNSDWHHNDWNNHWDDNSRNHSGGHDGGRTWNHDAQRGGARPDGGRQHNRDGNWDDRQRDGNRSGDWAGRQHSNVPLQQASTSPLRSRWADRSAGNAMDNGAARHREGAPRANNAPRVSDGQVANVGQHAMDPQLRARNDADQRLARSDRGARMNGQRDATSRLDAAWQRGTPASSFAMSGTGNARADRSRAQPARSDNTRARTDRVRPQPWQAEQIRSRPQLVPMDRYAQRNAQQQRFTPRTEVFRAHERPVQQMPRATEQRVVSQRVLQAPRVQQQSFREQRAPAPQQHSEYRGNAGEQRGNGRSQQGQRVASAQGDAMGNGRGGFRSRN